MASSKSAIAIIVFALAILRFHDSAASDASHFGGFDAIYSFGDSMADTGNLIREGLGPVGAFDRFPYGETYFGRPTGRCSNGRLMIDFIAQRFDLPFLNAYLDRNASFANGVNFAVAGATALDASYLDSVGIVLPFTKSSLNVQLDWFETHLASLCSTHEQCIAKLGTALFFLGEIGGNDYNYAIFKGKTISEATSLMPLIIKTIKHAAKKVIHHGARHLIVPGNFPTGCATCYLAAFRSTNSSDYDGRRCLKRYNEFAQLHNNQLQLMLQSLREQFPSVNIQYADYYNVSLQVLDNAQTLGVDMESRFQACCGAGGEYNFDPSAMCGENGTSTCSDPSKHLSWDGMHMTEIAYREMVASLFAGNLKGNIEFVWS